MEPVLARTTSPSSTKPGRALEVLELARHGYRRSPGTLYPALHRRENNGFLHPRKQRKAGNGRRVYRATRKGRRALGIAKEKVQELFGQLFENEFSMRKSGKRQSKG